MNRLTPCSNCSRPGSKIFHPGDCPGLRADRLHKLISPFRRPLSEEKDRRLYHRSTPGGYGDTPNPGAYGSSR